MCVCVYIYIYIYIYIYKLNLSQCTILIILEKKQKKNWINVKMIIIKMIWLDGNYMIKKSLATINIF